METADLELPLVLDEAQKELERTVASFVRGNAPIARVRKLRDTKDEVGFSRALWAQMAELGWVGMNIPEAYGGMGLGFFELSVVLEQLGRQLAPEPFLSTVLLGAQVLLRGGSETQKQAYLPSIAAGETVVTVAYAEAKSRFALDRIETKLLREGDTLVLDGEKTQVLDGHVADALIVSVKSAAGISLVLVPKDTPGLTIVRQNRIDCRNVAIARFSNVRVPASFLLGNEGAGLSVLQQSVDIASIGLAAESLGAAEQAFEMTLEYIRVRKQFGVPLGSFQALQHRVGRLFIKLALTRSAVLAAAQSVDHRPESLAEFATLAKARAEETFIEVVNEAVQMHGGVGVTDEHDIGFYLKRARAVQTTFGDASAQRRRWAELQGY
jgi:acyl-CoA dehydrogenase